jgi:hypothetical protein
MSTFTFPVDEENEAYCLEIAKAMAFYFGLSLDDAIGRINKHWQHTTFAAGELLFTQTTEYWARWIFLGPETWHLPSYWIQNQLRIERKLDQIQAHLGITPAPLSELLRELVRQGKRLEAIQLYMRETGVDLKRAQAEVDNLIQKTSLIE